MKSNNSFLLLAFSFLFVLASCSQARYGSMMRNSKPSPKDQKEVRMASNKHKSSIDEVSVNKEEIVLAEVREELKELSPEAFSVELTEETVNATPYQNIQKATEFIENAPIPHNPITKRITKKVRDNIEEAQEANDDSGLLRLILIIILVLIILNLILDLLPPVFTGILGAIILILLLLWLLDNI
ncbi:MAG: hypothetical protein JXR19_02285 [Bacteroidia bacterium]